MKNPVNYICYALLFFCIFSSGCRKDNSTNNNKNNNNSGVEMSTFYIRLNNSIGLAAVGDSVSFFGWLDCFKNAKDSAVPVSGHNYFWNFGDGDSFNYNIPYQECFVTPYHMYTSVGTYSVQLKIDDSIYSRPSTITICNDPVYTSALCRPRLWHGGLRIIYAIVGSNTTDTLNDSTFSIAYLDKVDVACWGIKHVYSTTLSGGNVLLFDIPSTGSIISYVYYNSLTDSAGINIYYEVTHGSGGGPPTGYQVSYHTP